MSTSVYNEFIIELLRNNIIHNCSAKKEAIRTFYNTNYRQRGQCSFSSFFRNLWYRYYIKKIKKETIYFDEQWLTYLNQQRQTYEPTTREVVAEKTIDNSRSCKLCLLKFSNEDVFQNHCNTLMHKVREQYLKNGHIENLEALRFEVVNAENTEEYDYSSLTLKLERKVNTNVTIKAVNITGKDIEILQLTQVNPYQKEVQILTNFERQTTLKHGENFNIFVKAYFENSGSFTLPIVVFYRPHMEQDAKSFLKEIVVEISSEFSSLKSGIPYRKPTKVKYVEEGGEIIPGEIPVVYESHYREEYPLKPYLIPKGLQRKLEDLTNVYPQFIDKFNVGRQLYLKFASLLNLNPVLTERNYWDLLDTLVSIEENQVKEDVRDYDTVSKLTSVGGNSYDLEVPGLCEARPSLIVHDSVYVKEGERDRRKYQGIVSKVFEKSVRLSFSHKFKQIYNKTKNFHIEFGYNRRTLKVQKQAVFLVREHDIVSYFYPKAGQGIVNQTVNKITCYNSNLNKEQKRAVTNILMDRSAPYLIFGPPGTGKTVTVVESILQIWKNKPHSRILVCAPSNSATDEIAVRLAETLPFSDLFRLVGQMYGHDKMFTHLKNIVNIDTDGSFYMPSMEQLLGYRVLLTTLATAARLVNGGVPDGHYSHVFIDESGYATESESLIPIAGILSNSTNRGKVVGQIVLAGDPRQLGPVVHSNFVKYCGYGTSMLERLIDTCEVYSRNEHRPTPYNERYVTKLLKNYRSHKDILNIPNKLFYHNELIPAGGASTSMFTKWEHLMTRGFPVIFHHIVGEDIRESNSPSFFNIQEIEEVMLYARKLVGSRVKDKRIDQEDIGIITPYRKQVQMLQKACAKQGWGDILVGSVEQFQGKEKLVIIISTVRSKNVNKFREIDKKCQLGFVSNAKRFNVALTRAKALLIVVGNGDVLKTDENWCQFIKYCVMNKSVNGNLFYLDDQEYLEEDEYFVQ